MRVTGKSAVKHRSSKKRRISVATAGEPKSGTHLPLSYNGEQVLPQFLNLDFATLKYDGHKYVDAAGRVVTRALDQLIYRELGDNLTKRSAAFVDLNGVTRKGNSLEALQNELTILLTPIIEAKWRSKDSPIDRVAMQNYLEQLVATLNQLRFLTRFQLVSATHKSRSRDAHKDVFPWGTDWMVKTGFTTGSVQSARPEFYGLIAESLINGELSLLRRCPCCRFFFVTTDLRSKYLPGHKFLYDKQPIDPTSANSKTRGAQRTTDWRGRKDKPGVSKEGKRGREVQWPATLDDLFESDKSLYEFSFQESSFRLFRKQRIKTFGDLRAKWDAIPQEVREDAYLGITDPYICALQQYKKQRSAGG